MNFLCVGLKEIDSGKTSLALALMSYLKEQGQDVCGFKPRAGNNLWYDWSIVKKSLDEGSLYGHDAKVLHEASSQEVPISVVNPAHRLWVPSYQEFTKGIPNFLLDRITTEKGTLVVKNEQMDVPISSTYFEQLLEKAEVYHISSREDLRKVTSLYNQADAWAHSILTEQFDTIVYESYADIGIPWQEISSIDYVFAITPFRIYTFNGDRYLRAYDVMSSFPEEEKTIRITKNIDPITTVNVPPFAEDVVTNLKRHISPYLDELLSF